MGCLGQSEPRCRIGSSPSLSSSWKSSHHTTPQTEVSCTWAALYAPKWFIQVQDSLALPPGRSSLRSLTVQEIMPYCFMFFDFCLFNCHTHVLVISPTLYYVISSNIMSRAYYSLYYYVILLKYSMSSIINRFAIIM